jgi:hypothetical protein
MQCQVEAVESRLGYRGMGIVLRKKNPRTDDIVTHMDGSFVDGYLLARREMHHRVDPIRCKHRIQRSSVTDISFDQLPPAN